VNLSVNFFVHLRENTGLAWWRPLPDL